MQVVDGRASIEWMDARYGNDRRRSRANSLYIEGKYIAFWESCVQYIGSIKLLIFH
jgi:hypothetical protein